MSRCPDVSSGDYVPVDHKIAEPRALMNLLNAKYRESPTNRNLIYVADLPPASVDASTTIRYIPSLKLIVGSKGLGKDKITTLESLERAAVGTALHK